MELMSSPIMNPEQINKKNWIPMDLPEHSHNVEMSTSDDSTEETENSETNNG